MSEDKANKRNVYLGFHFFKNAYDRSNDIESAEKETKDKCKKLVSENEMKFCLRGIEIGKDSLKWR